jgi:hypothetical protein
MSVTGWNILDNLLLGDGVVTTVQLVSIESEIDAIVKTIEDELASYKPEHFQNQGHVDHASWGAGDRASSIALHHSRAHGVMTDTLIGVRKDLRAYQQACRDARRFMEDADLTAAGDLAAIRNAVQALSTAAGSRQADDAYDRARTAHAGDGGDR